MKFKTWIENLENENFQKMKDVILNYLNLDPTEGLSQPIMAMNKQNLKQKLQGLGQFAELPSEIQAKVMSAIDMEQVSTMGDLIRMMIGS